MSVKRYESVDIFRGLTVAFMILVNTPGTWSHIYPPLEHAAWHGITPTDWIFPFFIFIVGTSIVLAYHSKKNSPSFNPYRKIITRSLKIFLLGLFLAGFRFHFPFFKDLGELRIPGVLQRIAIVFLITALLFVKIKNWKWFLLIFAGLVLGYWYAMTQIPIDGQKSKLTKTHNLASKIDRKILGKKHMWRHYEKEGYVQGDYDPEGIFSTLPAVATAILGVFMGLILVNQKISPFSKTILFLSIGLILYLLGVFWSDYFPLNKRLWTSSYVLYTGGLAYIFFALIFFLVEILDFKKWGNLFKYLGMNAITIFTLSVFITISFYRLKIPGAGKSIHAWLYHSIFANPLGNTELASFLYALSVVFFYGFIAWWLYKKKIFIKI